MTTRILTLKNLYHGLINIQKAPQKTTLFPAVFTVVICKVIVLRSTAALGDFYYLPITVRWRQVAGYNKRLPTLTRLPCAFDLHLATPCTLYRRVHGIPIRTVSMKRKCSFRSTMKPSPHTFKNDTIHILSS